MQRFPWSRDILGEASHADEVDHDLLMKLLMGGGKKKAATKPPAGMGAGQLAAAGLLRAFTREPE